MATAGQRVRGLDFPDVASDEELTDETARTSTSYEFGATRVGTTFMAPTSGRVLILWRARIESNTANTRAAVSVAVRTGSTIGSGTSVSPADDDSAIETSQGTTGGPETRIQASCHRVVSGLTAGDTYNVQMEHKMLSAGNLDIFSRSVDVIPLP